MSELAAFSAEAEAAAAARGDIAALAKGGRTNFFGFLLRLMARFPFLLIAGRLYGPAELGRFASALVIVELAGQLCTLGQKRGLAQRLSEDERHPANTVADGVLLSTGLAVVAATLLYLFPAPMFPSGHFSWIDRLIPLVLVPSVLTDLALAALAYRYDIATSVRSRAVVEPWTLSIAAGLLWFGDPDNGLSIAYILSIFAASIAALWPLCRSYGLPEDWQPHPIRLARLAISNLPLAAADAVEWGTRRLDIAILGAFASPATVGIYYVAQQIASLPQKLKTSFEPVLGPVITRNVKERNYAAIAQQVCQVGFWITAAQIGISLALGIPGEGVMGLAGPHFVGGTGALSFLLAAEIVASTAVVSEAALIYLDRIRNLWVSLGTIVLQAGLSVALVLGVGQLALSEAYRAVAVAAALMIALGTASLVKSRMLARLLDQSINTWRWALVWAAAPAVITGWLVINLLPEWAALLIGVPGILASYCWMIWRFGFGPEDRVLFRKNVGA